MELNKHQTQAWTYFASKILKSGIAEKDRAFLGSDWCDDLFDMVHLGNPNTSVEKLRDRISAINHPEKDAERRCSMCDKLIGNLPYENSKGELVQTYRCNFKNCNIDKEIFDIMARSCIGYVSI